MATLSFYGAAGTVTGSCSMVQAANARFLVDCGMFQGNKTIRALNDQPFPFDPGADFLILTHAHIDHSGLLPKLVKHGFSGPIYCTPPTADLLSFMLLDSAKIQRSNTERYNRRRQRKGEEPLEPIYSEEDARATLELLRTKDYDSWFEPKPGIHVRFWNAGHILGSASAELKIEDDNGGNTMRMLFSGDIGPEEKVFHPEPEAERGFDYVICESTYGDRERDDYTLEVRREMLRKELVRGLSAGGNVVIPAFAVERSQELLHDIGVLLANGELPETTVFLDSPLAKAVTEVFIKHAGTLDDVELDEAALFRDPRFRLVQDVEESKAINRITGGAIIISASGMADAGRIQHHIKNNIWRPNATILFAGYQAPGTLGYFITSGEPVVRIHGKEFMVKAEIRQLGNYSAHADQSELLDWVEERGPVVGRLFLNHGDDDAREEMARLLATRGFDPEHIVLPQMDESFELVAGDAKSKGRLPQRVPQAELLTDWNNDYAAFLVTLTRRLQDAKNDEERREIIAGLSKAL
ncbi:MBL fold metallo-hydrolase RNA specificity domain-containing protein [Oricola indica]|jgi:metallo-beta-lactamase family protein|uniref:MBL fold metallo-hydrolase RNA specificity domain-containing protein n=1 Tax=Oricola indica TaxID=2872591 RepID=UPI001CBE49D5|nr:MBL fold metallo-hydrolase [Oricola indica]